MPQAMVGGDGEARPAGRGRARVTPAGAVRLLTALGLLGILVLVAGSVVAWVAGTGVSAAPLGMAAGMAADGGKLDAAGVAAVHGRSAVPASERPAWAVEAAASSGLLEAAAGQLGGGTAVTVAATVAGLPSEPHPSGGSGPPLPPLSLVPPDQLRSRLRIVAAQPGEGGADGPAEAAPGRSDPAPAARSPESGHAAAALAEQSPPFRWPTWQAPAFAWGYRYLQAVHGLRDGRDQGSFNGLVLYDTAIQAMLQSPWTGNAVADAVLHWGAATGMLYGLSEYSRRQAWAVEQAIALRELSDHLHGLHPAEIARRAQAMRAASWWNRSGGFHVRDWRGDVGAAAVLIGLMELAKPLGQGGILPTPDGYDRMGRPVWATPRDENLNWTYDVLAHAIAGAYAGAAVPRRTAEDVAYRGNTFATIARYFAMGEIPPYFQGDEEFRAAMGRIGDALDREPGGTRVFDPDYWSRRLRSELHPRLFSHLRMGLTGAAISGLVRAVVTIPPNLLPAPLRDLVEAVNQVRLRPDEDSFGLLALSAGWNFAEAVVISMWSLVVHNTQDLRVIAERVWLTLRAALAHLADRTFLERYVGGGAEARRLGPLGGLPVWNPMDQGAVRHVLAARRRSDTAVAKLHAREPTSDTREEEHALRALLGAAALPGNVWDVATATLSPAPALDRRDQREVAARAREVLAANLAQIEASAEGYLVQKGYRLAGLVPPGTRAPDPRPLPGAGRGGRGDRDRPTPIPSGSRDDLLAAVRAHSGGSSTLVVDVLLPGGDSGQAAPADRPAQEPVAAPRLAAGPPERDLDDPPARQVLVKGELVLGLVKDGVEYLLVHGQLMQVQPDGGLTPLDPALLGDGEPVEAAVPPAPEAATGEQAAAGEQGAAGEQAEATVIAGQAADTGSGQAAVIAAVEAAAAGSPDP
jgi:hypothetical protein